MKRKLRVGFVGAGFIGQVAHLVNYDAMSNVEVVGLAELRTKLGGMICERYGIPNYYENHTALLENEQMDAVVAIVRRHHTASVGMDILNAGYHLFTEKPMAATVDQAEALVAAAARQGVVYSVGMMRRYDEGVQIAKRMLDNLIESGELGPVRYVRGYCFSGGDYCNISGHIDSGEPKPDHLLWPIAPDWLPTEKHKEYEHFLNVGSHVVNLCRYLFTTSPAVSYAQWRRPAGSTVIFDFGDFPMMFEVCDIDQNRYEEGIVIYFAKGKLTIDLPPAFLRNQPAQVELYKSHDAVESSVMRPMPDWTWAFKREDEAFVQDVENKSESISSGADCLNDMRLIDEVWRHLV